MPSEWGVKENKVERGSDGRIVGRFSGTGNEECDGNRLGLEMEGRGTYIKKSRTNTDANITLLTAGLYFKLLPVTHVLGDTWILTVMPVYNFQMCLMT